MVKKENLKNYIIQIDDFLEGLLFDYRANKTVTIRRTTAGLLLRLFQFTVILYFLKTQWCDKDYQESHDLSSSVTTKVKGVGLSQRSDISRKIWDTADSVVPPQEENGIFITTNVIETLNQTQNVCPESDSINKAKCEHDSQCPVNVTLYRGNGVMTGRCVEYKGGIKTCQVQAWCPLENDTLPTDTPLIQDVHNYTIFIKNKIIFYKTNIERSNLFAWEDENCFYNAEKSSLKYCPIFQLSYILKNFSKSNLTQLLTYGGVIRIIITWDCDLDESENDCKPEYSFSQLFTKSKLSSGYNFRYANYYEKDGKEYRMLYKVFGIRILIEVRGDGRQFSCSKFAFNVGSIIGWISLCEWITNIIVSNCWFEHRRNKDILCETDDKNWEGIFNSEKIKEICFCGTCKKTENANKSRESTTEPLTEMQSGTSNPQSDAEMGQSYEDSLVNSSDKTRLVPRIA